MLELSHITKSYISADFKQVALDDVSITFRDNEFVAVLGPSGSGKTTMLNIVGGLDRYDSGDLIIDGVSTDDYTDRDWDTYRNNRIGFVFQSYNLIPHQSVLANVELALTLTGVSREERRRRALEALSEVGLADHVRKRPNQLSGGQMQRVAIARALINDPEIVLADEPTGALDTETSEQIMALLTKIASDRLVIMVTHNPELAEDYATRTIDLLDGKVVSDSDPFDPAEQRGGAAWKIRKTSMSLATAIALSFNNLMTKKGRTLMTAFAGSIGIIGIASILALATGVQAYIKGVEEDMLSVYPLTIQDQGMDMTSMVTMMTEEAGNQAHAAAGVDVENGGDEGDAGEASPGGEGRGEEDLDEDAQAGTVREIQVLGKMFSSVGTNDLASLKEFLDNNGGDIDEYVSAIQYYYDVSPQIFSSDTTDGVRQVNPDKTFSSLGFSSESSFMGSNTMMNVFQEMVEDSTVVEAQYDVVAGAWPVQPTEVLVVLTPSGGLSDLMLYTLDLLDPADLDAMMKDLREGEQVVIPSDPASFTYDEIMDTTFKLVPATSFYTYDDTYGVWTDRSGDAKYMKTQVEEGTTLRVSGIVKAKEGATATALSPGIYYTPMLTRYVVNEAADTKIVKDQQDNPKVNVFTGAKFGEESGADSSRLDFSSLVSVDEDAIGDAFKIDEQMLEIDPSALGLDFSALEGLTSLDMGDLGDLDFDLPQAPQLDLGVLAGDLDFDLDFDFDMDFDLAGNIEIDWSQIDLDLAAIDWGLDAEQVSAAVDALVSGYFPWAEKEGLDPTDVATNFPLFLESDEAKAILGELDFDLDGVINQVLKQITDQVQGQLQDQIGEAIEQMKGQLEKELAKQLREQLASQLTQSLSTQLQVVMGSYMSQLSSVLTTQIQAAMQGSSSQMAAAFAGLENQIGDALTSSMQAVMGSLAETLPEAMAIDEEAFAEAFEFNMSEEELQRLLTSLMGVKEATYEGNLHALGYADFNDPSSIDLFPIDFNAKEAVVDVLETYNADAEAAGEDDKVVTYTDLVGTLMSSLTDIVNVITYVLIAFVAISLVVSSIMIGVITYISVLERRKEIGILRSIGASKRDIRTVFNAETLIVGFTAGLLGVGITYLMTLPVNAFVYAKWGIRNVAQLSLSAATILVLISMGLTVLAGLMPASAASRKDPVEALRSE